MADAPGTISRQAGTIGPDVPVVTKLYVPRLLPGFVPRPRLVDQLDAGLARGLTLVCAPAGFGKTALLADWVRRGRLPVAWLSLDEGDNDPTRFWRHVASALDRVVPGIGEQVAPLLGPPPPPSYAGLVAALINELAAQPSELLLVLDDYHLIEAQPVHASLAFLLEHLPPTLHVVLVSRDVPLLPLARLRARGQLADLRAAELRFTVDEAAALLRAAVGSDLPDDAVAAVAARTEGWAAGLQLAALSLRGEPDVGGFVATFGGSHRHIVDYLTEEVLERQPAGVQWFLLETSVLERLSGPLCDAVTGRADGQAMLEGIERANLFLVPLDEVRGWWRYHHLFADVLRVRLERQRPERAVELHRNAAGWCEDHGLVDDAMRHVVAAGEMSWAARMIERHFDALFRLGERTTIQRWFAALPGELLRSRLRLCLAQMFLAQLGSDVEAIETPLGAAERAAADAADEPFEPSVGRAASWLGNIPAAIALGRAFLAYLRGDAEGTVEFASRALGMLGSDEWKLGSVALWHLAVADRLRGRLGEAERAFAASAAEWRLAGELGLATSSCNHLGQVQRAQGRLNAALETYRQTLRITAAPGPPAQRAAGVAYVGMAEVAYQRNDLDAARRHLGEGIALCRQLSYSQPLATGLATLAAIRQASGDAGGARAVMSEAVQVAPMPTVASLLNPVPSQWARLLLAQGEADAALRWTKERGLDADDEPDYSREPEYLLLARVLLAHDRPAEALRLLGRLHALAETQRRTASLIEIRALQALALAAGGDEAAAVAALAEALTLACPQGYVRIFVDEGAPMGALLGRLVAAQRTDRAADRVPLDYLGRLVQAFEQDATRTAPRASAGRAVVPGLVAVLSDRELEVLRLLAAGKPNREIADELFVAPTTVKKHVTHILDKLGAVNRTEATARARELGLLP